LLQVDQQNGAALHANGEQLVCGKLCNKNSPRTLEDLNKTCSCASSITEEALHHVTSNKRKEVDASIAEHSGHLQHLI
jgi:hypothetical protein